MKKAVKIDGYIYAGTSGDFAETPFRTSRRNKKTALFEVVGDSMTGDDIWPGDRIRVRLSPVALPGMLCAIRTPYGPVLKRFEPKREGLVILRSSNPEYLPQLWEGVELQIIGIVMAVIH